METHARPQRTLEEGPRLTTWLRGRIASADRTREGRGWRVLRRHRGLSDTGALLCCGGQGALRAFGACASLGRLRWLLNLIICCSKPSRNRELILNVRPLNSFLMRVIQRGSFERQNFPHRSFKLGRFYGETRLGWGLFQTPPSPQQKWCWGSWKENDTSKRDARVSPGSRPLGCPGLALRLLRLSITADGRGHMLPYELFSSPKHLAVTEK